MRILRDPPSDPDAYRCWAHLHDNWLQVLVGRRFLALAARSDASVIEAKIEAARLVLNQIADDG